MKDNDLLQFEDFVLDLRERVLSKNNRPVPIQPKVLSVLEVLIINAGHIVEKETLIREVWADTFVEDSNLTFSIRQLRKILNDDIREPKYIETVPRRGYRFIRPVEAINANPVVGPGDEKTPPKDGKEGLFAQILSRKKLMTVIAVAALFFAGMGLAFFGSWKDQGQSAAQNSLAVLPFVNLKPSEETDYLGFAFADTLNTKITSMRNFRAFPTALAAKYKSPQDFLSENKTDYLVTGTFLKEGNKLTITSQVFDTKKSETLFQDSFVLNEEQLSQTSEYISRRLINELRLRPQEISKYADMSEINPQAYNYFLRGIEQHSRFRLAESIENLEKAVAIAPNFPVAWDKLGDSYLVNASTHFGGESYYLKAENCFRKAISLDAGYTLPQIHLTDILIETNRKEEAIEILRLVLENDPENPMVWWELSYAFRFAGKLEKSIEAGEKAHQLDPGFFLNNNAPNYYLYAGDYQKFKNSVSRRTDSAYIKFYQGFAEYHLNNREAAKLLFDEAFQLDSNSMQTQIGKAFSLMIQGENEKARLLLLKVEKNIAERHVSDGEGIYKLAQAFAVLGDNSKALKMFGLSIEKGFFCYPYFQTDPLIHNLRNEKSFAETLEKARHLNEGFRY